MKKEYQILTRAERESAAVIQQFWVPALPYLKAASQGSGHEGLTLVPVHADTRRLLYLRGLFEALRAYLCAADRWIAPNRVLATSRSSSNDGLNLSGYTNASLMTWTTSSRESVQNRTPGVAK